MSDTSEVLEQELQQTVASTQVLRQQLRILEAREIQLRDALGHHDLEVLDLSVRVYLALKRAGLNNVSDVLRVLKRGPDALLAIRSFGKGALDQVERQLRAKGYL